MQFGECSVFSTLSEHTLDGFVKSNPVDLCNMPFSRRVLFTRLDLLKRLLFTNKKIQRSSTTIVFLGGRLGVFIFREYVLSVSERSKLFIWQLLMFLLSVRWICLVFVAQPINIHQVSSDLFKIIPKPKSDTRRTNAGFRLDLKANIFQFLKLCLFGSVLAIRPLPLT